MGADHGRPTRSTRTSSAGLARNAPLTRPRPGHADLAGMQKYGFDDARPVLERARPGRPRPGSRSAPSPNSSCAPSLGAEVVSHVVSIGEGDAVDGPLPAPADRDAIDESPGAGVAPGFDRAA